jgi:hypothetical protein
MFVPYLVTIIIFTFIFHLLSISVRSLFVTDCLAIFNPYSGKMNKSMDNSQMETTAHDELDKILRGVLEDEDAKMTEVGDEVVNMDISIKGWIWSTLTLMSGWCQK